MVCCRSIKTTIIGAAVTSYQSLFSFDKKCTNFCAKNVIDFLLKLETGIFLLAQTNRYNMKMELLNKYIPFEMSPNGKLPTCGQGLKPVTFERKIPTTL